MTRLLMIAGALVAGLWVAACDEPSQTPGASQSDTAPGGGTSTTPSSPSQ